MHKTNQTLKIAVLLFTGFLSVMIANPAYAESYIELHSLVAAYDKPDSKNIGGAFAVGYNIESCRAELEVSHHMHLGNTTAALMGMGYCDFGDRIIVPYLGIGGGYTVADWNFDRPVVQGAIGAAIKVSDNVEVVLGYAHRSYFNDITELGNIENFANSEDGTIVLGFRIFLN